MLMLAIRTDSPVSELYLYDSNTKLAEIKWEANRTLADTIHGKIEELLNTVQGLSLYSIERIGIYEGPGSFTGLRIGISVANTLGYSLNVPLVPASGENWILDCIKSSQTSFVPAIPKYGSEPHITQQKK